LAFGEEGLPSEHTVLDKEKGQLGGNAMQDHESKRSRVNRRKFVSRRNFVGGAAAMGGAFAFPWHLARAEGVPNEYDGSKFQLAAPEPNPKSG
jgi:hypothetical protein